MPTLNEETIQKKEMGKLGKLSIVIGTVDKFSKTFSKAKAGLAGIG